MGWEPLRLLALQLHARWPGASSGCLGSGSLWRCWEKDVLGLAHLYQLCAGGD